MNKSGTLSIVLAIIALLSEIYGKSSLTKFHKEITNRDIKDYIPEKKKRTKEIVRWVALIVPLPAGLGAFFSGLLATYSYIYPPKVILAFCDQEGNYTSLKSHGIDGLKEFLRKCPNSQFSKDAAGQYRRYIHHEFEGAKLCTLSNACHPEICLSKLSTIASTDSDLDIDVDIDLKLDWLEQNAKNAAAYQCATPTPSPPRPSPSSPTKMSQKQPAQPSARNVNDANERFTRDIPIAVIATKAETLYQDKNAAEGLSERLAKKVQLAGNPEEARLKVEVLKADAWASPPEHLCSTLGDSIYSGWNGKAKVTIRIIWTGGRILLPPQEFNDPIPACAPDADVASQIAFNAALENATNGILSLVEGR